MYCTKPPSSRMFAKEIEERELAMSTIEKSVKAFVNSIIRWFGDLYECLQHLRVRYVSNLDSKKLLLLYTLVFSKKDDIVSMEQ